MDHVYFTTTKHEKGKHLSYDERVLIQIRLKDGWSANKIAKEIGVLQTLYAMRYTEVLSPCILDVSNQESSRRLGDGSL